MKTKLFTCITLLTFGVLCSGVARGQGPAAERPVVQLEADSSELGKRGTGLEDVVLERLGPGLEAEGINTSGKAEDIGVRVRILPVDMEAFHYSIRFELEDEDGDYAQVLSSVDCKPCIDATLLAKIDARTPALADMVKARARGEAIPTHVEAGDEGGGEESGGDETGGEEGESEGEGGEEDGGEVPGPVPKPIGALGISGGVGLALGLGLSIGGAVVLAKPTQRDIELNEQFGMELDRTPLGIGLLVPGATLVIAGTIMLAVDVSKRAKQRKRAENLTVLPTFSPTSAGIGVAGRF